MMIAAFTSPAASLLRKLPSVSLWAIAAAHVLLLVSFLLVLATAVPARAETGCTGQNLLDALKQDDPQRYAAMLAEGNEVPNGKGLLWRIERDDVAPSYLLGTMHVSDPRVLRMPDGAADAHRAARTIIIESDEILDEKKAMAALLAKPELTMFTDGNSIESLLPKDDLAILEAGLKEKGIPLGAVSRMKPWMLASFVALPACEASRKAAGAMFLDKKIALDAIAGGKAVKGLETLAEQLTAMTELPLEFHLQALVETVKLGERMDDIVETMTQLYLKGETGLTIPALKAVTPATDGGDESAYVAFESAIISKRNHRMAERAAPLLAGGHVFMAVGALHLPGEDGLVELLRGQGFTVTAVNRPVRE